MGKPSKQKEKERRKQKERYEHEKQKLVGLRKDAKQWKAALRTVGCDLPFYDVLDSYEAEFNRLVEAARREFKTLREVRVIDRPSFVRLDVADLGYPEDRLIHVAATASEPDYREDKPGKVTGGITFFVREPDADFSSVIILPSCPIAGPRTPEIRYAALIGIFLHEVGHVADAERGGFLDPRIPKFDVVEGEAYANCFALERLADRCLGTSYEFLFDTIILGPINDEGFPGKVSRRVCELHPRREIPSWQSYLEAAKPEFLKIKLKAAGVVV